MKLIRKNVKQANKAVQMPIMVVVIVMNFRKSTCNKREQNY